jgi:hypothetical protein
MLDASRRYATPGDAGISFPGPEGGYGAAVDSLEGFARTFLIAGFVLTGRRGHDPADLLDRYSRGLATGTNPDAENRWPRLDEHPQGKVEAASLALILDMTRPWLWDGLDSTVQRRIINYLAAAVGDDTYPRINWVWFRLVVQTFLKSVDGPYSEREMRADLATHDTFVRPGGWLSDGAERSFDHYSGWALHLYPALWARMSGAQDLAASRSADDRARLDRFLTDALSLVGADGAPLIQGRSLIYRFAAAAPMWAGILSDVPSHDAATLKNAAMRIVSHFADRGAPNKDGVLSLGWYEPWPALAQSYSGPGSPYWAAKGLLGLALPADHPVWSREGESLPVETDDVLRVAEAPGWIISGTSDDGIIRVINHGTDHATEGSFGGDSPLYTRLGYSTRTSPMLDEQSWRNPLDNTVCLVDGNGRATHRAGMTSFAVSVDDDTQVAVGASRSDGHWIEPAATQQRHGGGLAGSHVVAGTFTVVSVVHREWEVRCVWLHGLTAAGRDRANFLRIGGWPVASDTDMVQDGRALVHGTQGTSILECDHRGARAQVHRREHSSPLSAMVGVPTVDIDLATLEPAQWVVALVALRGVDADESLASARPQVQFDGHDLEVVWPDDVRSRTALAPYLSREGAVLSSQPRVNSDPLTTLTKEAQ